MGKEGGFYNQLMLSGECVRLIFTEEIPLFIPMTFKGWNCMKRKPLVLLQNLLLHTLRGKRKKYHTNIAYIFFSTYSHEVTWHLMYRLLCLWSALKSFLKVQTHHNWWTLDSSEEEWQKIKKNIKSLSIMESTMQIYNFKTRLLDCTWHCIGIF